MLPDLGEMVLYRSCTMVSTLLWSPERYAVDFPPIWVVWPFLDTLTGACLQVGRVLS